jgi:hypothetical protein
VLTLMALLRPRSVDAQQAPSSAQNPSGGITTSASGASAPSQTFTPPTANPYQRPGSSAHEAADRPADAAILRRDSKWTSALAHYAFDAAPSFYSPSYNQPVGVGADWNSSLTGVFAANANPKGTTYLRMTTDLELYGQKRDAGEPGPPGGKDITMEWEAAHLIPSRLGSVEFAAGIYRQQLLSYSAFPNTALADSLPGYTVLGSGLETSVTLPDKNLTLSFRSGRQYLKHGWDKARVSIFALSWTW